MSSRLSFMAGVEGVEPPRAVPETGVLPLDDTPVPKRAHLGLLSDAVGYISHRTVARQELFSNREVFVIGATAYLSAQARSREEPRAVVQSHHGATKLHMRYPEGRGRRIRPRSAARPLPHPPER